VNPDFVGFGLVVDTDGVEVRHVIDGLDCAAAPRLLEEAIGLISRSIRSAGLAKVFEISGAI
jgi:hypothetical protein